MRAVKKEKAKRIATIPLIFIFRGDRCAIVYIDKQWLYIGHSRSHTYIEPARPLTIKTFKSRGETKTVFVTPYELAILTVPYNEDKVLWQFYKTLLKEQGV